MAAQPVPDSARRRTCLAANSRSRRTQRRPWVYWFWLNGNITREGITADLEAMKRVGIGGGLIMEVDQGAPVGPVDFMSAQWRELFQHVQRESQRLGSGNQHEQRCGLERQWRPVDHARQAMQKVVWSETEVTGPQEFAGTLPQPETVAGFYRDICVLAFPKTGDYRIDRIRAKAMFEVGGVGGIARDELPANMLIDRQKIVTLTEQMDSEGRSEVGRPGREPGPSCGLATPARARKTRRHRPAVADWNATSSARQASKPISPA